MASNDEFTASIERLLDEHDAQRRAAVERMEQLKASELAFLEDFARVRRTVVRPALEVLAKVMTARGHRFTIVEDEVTNSPGGNATEAAIGIRVIPIGQGALAAKPEQCPMLSFTTRRYNRTVAIVGANLGPLVTAAADAHGGYQISQITKTLVEDKLLTLVERIVAR